jgi:hypothetical protein
MDRLYAPLAAISRGIDQLILQNLIALILLSLFAVTIGLFRKDIQSANSRLKALLIDTSSWQRIADVTFNVFPNGRVEWASPDGFGTGRSIEKLERFIDRRLKARGQSFDKSAFRTLVAGHTADAACCISPGNVNQVPGHSFARPVPLSRGASTPLSSRGMIGPEPGTTSR